MKMHMKKYAVLPALTLGLAVLAAPNSEAVFSSVSRSTTAAVAQLVGNGTVAFNIAIKKVADNSLDTQVNFNGVTLPSGWKVASNYIQMNSTVTTSGGGIQIYTDNVATDASPRFTGSPATTDPAGLVDNTNRQLRLPMAWSIKASTGIPNVPNAAEPNNSTTDPNAPQWVYFKDRATVDIAAQGTVHFTNGEQAIELLDGSLGIHAVQTQFFPGSFPVTYIYPEVNFSLAVTPNTYATNKLTVEAFTQ